jgi:nucleoid DNA-binding protein
MSGIHDIARKAGLKDTQVQSVFAAVLELVNGVDGNDKPLRVQVKGFGSFACSTLAARTISSPVLAAGTAEVPQRQVLRFKASPTTKAYLNGTGELPTIGDTADEPEAEAAEAEAVDETGDVPEGDAEPEAEPEPPPPPPKAKPVAAKPAAAPAPVKASVANAAKAVPAKATAPVAPAAKPVAAKPAAAPAKAAPVAAKPVAAAAKPATKKAAPPPPPAEEPEEEAPGEFTGD